MSKVDFTDTQKIDAIFQEAVDKAMPLCVAVSFRAQSRNIKNVVNQLRNEVMP